MEWLLKFSERNEEEHSGPNATGVPKIEQTRECKEILERLLLETTNPSTSKPFGTRGRTPADSGDHSSGFRRSGPSESRRG